MLLSPRYDFYIVRNTYSDVKKLKDTSINNKSGYLKVKVTKRMGVLRSWPVYSMSGYIFSNLQLGISL